MRGKEGRLVGMRGRGLLLRAPTRPTTDWSSQGGRVPAPRTRGAESWSDQRNWGLG
jgi:hypothetical protein